LLLLCFLATTQRFLAATAPNCQSLHPQCTSCATKTKLAHGPTGLHPRHPLATSRRAQVGNHDDCTACGTGLTTAQTASQSPVDCVPLPGWKKDTPNMAYATPCLLRWYSAGGNSADKRLPCPQGSTTEFPMSNDISQCSVCSAGWGGYTANGVTTCNLCTVGTYSPGGTDNPCIACQEGETSPPGASDSSDCFDTFGSFGE
jgi:hypothetical protein